MVAWTRVIAVVGVRTGNILAIFYRSRRIVDELDIESGITSRFLV